MIVLACGCISFGEAKICHMGTSKAVAIFSNVVVVNDSADTICLTAERLTFILSANSCCVILFSFNSSLILILL